MPSSTARLRPSASSRWLMCTASPALEQELLGAGLIGTGDDGSSPYADEGTQAHALARDAFYLGWDEAIEDGDFPEDMQGHVKDFLNYCTSIPATEVRVETKVPLWYDKENTGTVDHARLNEEDNEVFIIDLKYGAGVSVSAKNNTQLLIYMRSLVDQLRGEDWVFLPDDKLHMVIFQPRIEGESPVRQWTVTYDDLMKRTEWITSTVADIAKGWQGGLKYYPSEDTCRWCPCKSRCSARGTALIEMGEELKDDDSGKLISAAYLSDVQRLEILNMADDAIKLINDIREDVTRQLTLGEDVPGWKLVEGRGSRTWADEAAADKLLSNHLSKEERTETSLLSVAKAEKALKGKKLSTKFKNRWNDVVSKRSGKPTLARVTDKRPAINLVLENEFADTE